MTEVGLPADLARRFDLLKLSLTLATLRDSTKPDELREAWVGWHKTSIPMRGPFQKYIAPANKGARKLDFADTGAMWRAKYDMRPMSSRPKESSTFTRPGAR